MIEMIGLGGHDRPSERIELASDDHSLLNNLASVVHPQYPVLDSPSIDDILDEDRTKLKDMFKADHSFSTLFKMIIFSFIGQESLMIDVSRAKTRELKDSTIFCVTTAVEKLAYPSKILVLDFNNRDVSKSALESLAGVSVFIAHNLHKAEESVCLELLEAVRLKSLNGKRANLPDFFMICTVDSSDDSVESGGCILPFHFLRHVMACVRPSGNDLRHVVSLNPHIHGYYSWDSSRFGVFRALISRTTVQTHAHSKRDFVFIDQSIRRYMRDIAVALRQHSRVAVGPSLHESTHLTKMCQISALMNGKLYVRPMDVDDVAVHVLAHRILLDKQGSTFYDLVESSKLVYNVVQKLLRPPI
eukprot:TRINITY_DN52523_c0_g1_i1.p1 TRINITY_DN52523_c0_g1~~TRINITY_DN52523_c0_g1_i1.p1  ORF type:complete len:359 (-),score=68.82 TRINITY_DN52523_c0_g1_i1:91-1167(-)